MDREKITPPTEEQISSVAAAVNEMAPRLDAVIFEDYGKGFVTEKLVSEVVESARKNGKIVAADPNPRHSISWRGVSVVKPNRAEAFHAAGIPWSEPVDEVAGDEPLHRVGETLLQKWGAEIVLITLGEQGMILFQPRKAPHHVPTKAQQVYDVSGAGDTAIALFTLALTAGATPLEAAEIANHASAVVVGKLGTATVSRAELQESIEQDES